jgi:hypothetical protein
MRPLPHKENAMFKKHSVQMKVVKDAPAPDTDPTADFIYAINSTELVVDRLIKSVVKAAVTVTAVKTASELALHIAKTYIK